jgi:hypothetical protein
MVIVSRDDGGMNIRSESLFDVRVFSNSAIEGLACSHQGQRHLPSQGANLLTSQECPEWQMRAVKIIGYKGM